MRWFVSFLTVVALLTAPLAGWAQEGRCANGKSSNSAMWLSIAHPGLGEWFLKDWGPFSNAPPRKFWLGFIPFYGWPGYLQVKSAIDAKNCRTNDEI